MARRVLGLQGGREDGKDVTWLSGPAAPSQRPQYAAGGGGCVPRPRVLGGVAERGALPSRSALDPCAFGGVIDRVFLAERTGKGLVQVRVAGSTLADLAGTDLCRLPLSCPFTPGSRFVLALALEDGLACPAVVEVGLRSDRDRIGRARAQHLLLPLEDEAGCRQVLGVIGFRKGIAACRLQSRSQHTGRLTSPSKVAKPPSVPRTAAPALGRKRHLRRV